jgi:hypothetical protein
MISIASPLKISRQITSQKLDDIDVYLLNVDVSNTMPDKLKEIHISEYVGMDVKNLKCKNCVQSGDEIIFELASLNGFGTTKFTATYSVGNSSFETEYTIQMLKYYVKQS